MPHWLDRTPRSLSCSPAGRSSSGPTAHWPRSWRLAKMRQKAQPERCWPGQHPQPPRVSYVLHLAGAAERRTAGATDRRRCADRRAVVDRDQYRLHPAGDVQRQQACAGRTAIRAARRISIGPSGAPRQRDRDRSRSLPAVVDLAAATVPLGGQANAAACQRDPALSHIGRRPGTPESPRSPHVPAQRRLPAPG
jgi:hypothetical protein